MPPKPDLARLKALAGEENVSVNPLDLLAYSRDLAPLPDALLKSYGAIPPDAVVRASSVEQAAAVVRYAYESKIPITPRGGGSFALGGVIPLEGGIVLDLTGMRRVLEISRDEGWVRVEAGIEWKRLIDVLEREGFQPGANASSGVSATVGGYIGTGGGAGIGVPRYGVLGNQLLSLKVIRPDGAILETNPWESAALAGAEGTLGIVAEATLRIFPKPAERYRFFAFSTVEAGAAAMAGIARMRPYFLHFFDRGAIHLLNRSGARFKDAAFTLLAILQGTEAELEAQDEAVREICRGAEAYSDEEARAEWRDRYVIELKFKRLGPTLMVQELRLPIGELPAVLGELASLLEGRDWGVQSLGSDEGAVCLLIFILTDERNKTAFFKAMSLAGPIPKIGYRHGGTVYGISLHNGAHLGQIHHPTAVRTMRALKARWDPENLLNPCKTVVSRIPPLFVDLAMLSMRLVPGLVACGMGIAGKMPLGLIRTGLKLTGGRLR